MGQTVRLRFAFSSDEFDDDAGVYIDDFFRNLRSSAMRRHQQVLFTLLLPCIAAAWWGCAKGSGETGSSASLSTSSSGSGDTGGSGGGIIIVDGGAGGGTGGACSSTSSQAHRVPLDMIFVVDQSDTMEGDRWTATTSGLTTFFNDPASAAISIGMEFLPAAPSDCTLADYEQLVVPIAPLPSNAFALTNALPAAAGVYSTPFYAALKGALLVATAYQDAHPTEKVVVVLATDGDPEDDDLKVCGTSRDDVAALAASALAYDGVRTYVIGLGDIMHMNQIAAAGGTTAAFDITQDISQFSATIAQIRSQALGCDFDIPAPPHGKELNPAEVNVNYTPGGMGTPILLPRAQNHGDCNGGPGWYYDDNSAPTEIVLCPASCSTVQSDDNAKVSVLFGCTSVQN